MVAEVVIMIIVITTLPTITILHTIITTYAKTADRVVAVLTLASRVEPALLLPLPPYSTAENDAVRRRRLLSLPAYGPYVLEFDA